MSLTAAAMRLLADKGLTLDDVIAVAEANSAPADASAERRRAKDRERKRGKSAEIPQNGKPDIPRNSAEFPQKTATLARVEDKPLTTEGPCLAAVVVLREADDWPEANALELLCAAVGAPRLDHTKTPGLITTSGRMAAWRTAGAGWSSVVVPVVSAVARKQGPPIQSWAFFDAAIGQALAQARKPLEIPEAANERPHSPAAKRNAREDNLSRSLAGFDAATSGTRLIAGCG